MSGGACRACRGEWPAAEAFIADCGPTKAYLHEDQFFPGWTVLVLKRHVTELYDLERDERGALMDAVSEVARAVAAVYHAVKHDAVVKSFARQGRNALDVAGRKVGAQLDDDVAAAGKGEGQAFGVGHDMLRCAE